MTDTWWTTGGREAGLNFLVAKLLPLFICWGGTVWLLAGMTANRRAAVGAAVSGFALGCGGGVALFALMPGAGAFAAMRLLLAVVAIGLGGTLWLLLLFRPPRNDRLAGRWPLAWPLVAGLLAGLVTSGRVPLAETSAAVVAGLAVAGLLAPLAGLLPARRQAQWLPLTGSSTPLVAGALLLLLAAHSPRLDLFSVLAMKVMKFTHDVAHQFFETLLLPDHPFLRGEVWDLIGVLFSAGIGNWLGGAIWLLPAVAGTALLAREPLPGVAAIRSGPSRRLALAEQLAERRRRVRAPLVALVILGAAIFRSLVPVTEYWDPPPLPVTADSAGHIVIPLATSAYDLGDGRLRKFVYRRKTTEVRFLLVTRPDGKLIGALDACAICPPDGYGQGEGSVFCYYCRTLIPLETVGAAGGCNPVPITLKVTAESVTIDEGHLRGAWLTAVQPRKNVPRRGGM